MALKGISVIELSGLAPVPLCGMILSDFGALVTRIDKIGEEPVFDCLGNGKQSVSLNLKCPKGTGILRSLVKKNDVLIEPFRKGVMEHLGLGPGILMKDNPRLIYARLTGYGQSGPYSSRAGHDLNYVGLSGLLSLFGRHSEKPIFPANLIADFGGGGLMCAMGIILALLERNVSNLGQVVDNSMVEGTAYLGSWLYRSQSIPGLWGSERGKNLLDSGAHFYEVYKTKDGKFMAVGAIEPQFYTKLLEGLNLSHDEAPHFGNFEESKQLFTQKFLEKTQKEWCEIFEDVDACVTPVLSLEDVSKHKHNMERETFVANEKYLIPRPAPNLSRTPGQSSSVKAAPHKGQHTKLILKSLNYSDEYITQLEEEGVIECYKTSKL